MWVRYNMWNKLRWGEQLESFWDYFGIILIFFWSCIEFFSSPQKHNSPEKISSKNPVCSFFVIRKFLASVRNNSELCKTSLLKAHLMIYRTQETLRANWFPFLPTPSPQGRSMKLFSYIGQLLLCGQNTKFGRINCSLSQSHTYNVQTCQEKGEITPKKSWSNFFTSLLGRSSTERGDGRGYKHFHIKRRMGPYRWYCQTKKH